MGHINNENKCYLFIILCEIVTAVIYAKWIAPDLAAMHNDMQVFIPMALLFITALCFLSVLLLCGVYLLRSRRKKITYEWNGPVTLLLILATLMLWAIALLIISGHTDCCTGG
ncbi:hypothetical protein [Clostridium transplantifaecale]|uniref:hypothetical protein n=1 Tax=Clostridium transplantifaecale TaxID=2479838 RepID=UPI000F63B3A8|nr:hypothetical protein [Clostridium transplantifaecale]